MKRTLKKLGRDKAFRLRKCKPYILVFCVLLALFEMLGSTLAWYTSADSCVNSMTTPADKHFAIYAVDAFDPDPKGGLYNKRVGAANGGEKPSLVRLLVTAVFEIPSTTPGEPPNLLPATIGGPYSDALVIMSDFNGTDWIDATDLSSGGDGYFYYKYILEPDESTDTGHSSGEDHNLFNRVTLVDPLPLCYENAHLVIEVKCEAVGIRPPEQYIDSWWDGIVPVVSSALHPVYLVLQQALGL